MNQLLLRKTQLIALREHDALKGFPAVKNMNQLLLRKTQLIALREHDALNGQQWLQNHFGPS